MGKHQCAAVSVVLCSAIVLPFSAILALVCGGLFAAWHPWLRIGTHDCRGTRILADKLTPLKIRRIVVSVWSEAI